MGWREPAFKITLDGKDISAGFRPRLVSLTLTEKRGGEADQLDIVLDDADGALDIPRKGVVITLALGYAGEPLVNKGAYKVDETSHSGAPDILTITARSANLSDQLRLRREQAFKESTLGEVLGQVAARNALTLAIAPALAGIAVPVLAQSRESDAALLSRLGDDHDAVATIKAGRLVFNPKGAGSTPSGKKIPSAVITRRDGDQHTWKSADRDASYTGVTASWHDMGAARKKNETVGVTGKRKHLKKVYASKAQAAQAAKAEMGRIKRSDGSFSLTLALGRPDLYPERGVTLQGWKPQIDAKGWLISQATHALSDNALTTALEMEAT